MKLLTTAEMQDLEAASEAAGVSTATLMENAGLAVAQEVWMTLGSLEDRAVLILVGPGNNGGDGLVAARHLHEWGAQVAAYCLRHRPADDPHTAALRAFEIPVVSLTDDDGFETLEQFLSVAELVVDALLGTGTSRPIEGDLAEIMRRLAAARERPGRLRLLAVDLPTGVDADTGRADPLSVTADLTVALGEAKLGLYLGEGSIRAGRVQVVDIGIPATVERPAGVEMLDRAWVKRQLPRRPADANKGTFGRVLVFAGSERYVGAASLAAAAAYRGGAGLVSVAASRAIQPMIAARLAEATFLLFAEWADAPAMIAEVAPEYDALLVGCGLSMDAAEAVRALLADLGDHGLRGVVLDADALNALAPQPDWWTLLPARAVLTPHPGEMARLSGRTVAEIQANRLPIARAAAEQWGAVIVLKGANTVIAAPDGQAWLAPFANPLLATAGTGDVLAGVISGLLSQGVEPALAAACGVYLHGMAGDALRADIGPAGALASDLLIEIPRAVKALVEPAPLALPARPGERGGAGLGLASLGGLSGLSALGLGGLADGPAGP